MPILIFILLSTVLCIYANALISGGVILGILTFTGLAIIVSRSTVIMRLCRKAPLAAEIGSAALTYWILGGTITGLIAAAVVGIGTSCALGLTIGKSS